MFQKKSGALAESFTMTEPLSLNRLPSFKTYTDLLSLHFARDVQRLSFLHSCPRLRYLWFGNGFILRMSHCQWFTKLPDLKELHIFDTFVPNSVMSHLLTSLPSSTSLRRFSLLFRPARWDASDASELLDILADRLPLLESLSARSLRVGRFNHCAVAQAKVMLNTLDI